MTASFCHSGHVPPQIEGCHVGFAASQALIPGLGAVGKHQRLSVSRQQGGGVWRGERVCGASGSESSQALFSCREAVSERQRGSVSRGREQGVRRGERVSCVTGSERSQRTHLWVWPSHMVCLLEHCDLVGAEESLCVRVTGSSRASK